MRCLSVDYALTHGCDQKCDRVSLADVVVVWCRQTTHDVPEYTGQVEYKAKCDTQNIAKVFYKYTIMKQKTTDTKNYSNQCDQNWNHIQDIQSQRNAPYSKHSNDDQQRNAHLEAVDTYSDNQKDEFWYIYFGYDWFVVLDDLDTLQQTLVKKVPESDADKNEDRKVLFFRLKYISEHEYIDQHEAQRIQYPPEPVQIGIGYFSFQLGFRRVNGILPVLLHVIPKSFKHKIRSYIFFIKL